MSELVANCPRCGSIRITFDLKQENYLYQHYNWQYWYEAFCICRNCKKATIFILSLKEYEQKDKIWSQGLLKLEKSVNNYMSIEGHVSLKDMATNKPPEHLPENIAAAFNEGATCLAVGCYNAAGTMFRLCIDFATRSKLPEADEKGLNSKTRRDLGLRLPWLFENDYLPESLRELSTCVKEDGNDGAHAGTLTEDDAEYLLDFTVALLERMYTEPERIRIAKERRESRREPKSAT